MTEPLPLETLAWLRQTARLEGGATAQVLLHLLERLEELEATNHLAARSLASMRRAHCDHRRRLLNLEAAQQQHANPAPAATEMVATHEGAPVAAPTPHGYAYRCPGLLGGIEFSRGQEVNGSRPIEAIPCRLGVPPAAQPTPSALPANYIDPGHQGEDLTLLEAFCRACKAEGGTADEIYLKAIRAVLAASPAALFQQQESRITTLRSALTDCGRAVGASIGDDCTDGFLLEVPQKVRLAVAKPVPAVVPVRLCERLPDPRPESEGGDCDEEGKCWFLQPRSATPFPNWTFLWRGHMGGSYYSHWLPASAIPAPSNYIRDQKSIRPDSCSLPQAGEGEGMSDHST
jgi:hypothetical protein